MKAAIRPVLMAVLTRRLLGTKNRARREALWRHVRRYDDRDDTYSRALMKRLLDIEVAD